MEVQRDARLGESQDVLTQLADKELVNDGDNVVDTVASNVEPTAECETDRSVRMKVLADVGYKLELREENKRLKQQVQELKQVVECLQNGMYIVYTKKC